MINTLSRKEKIEFLKAIQSGRKSLRELVYVPSPEIWEDVKGQTGYVKEIISGRVCTIDELKKENSANQTKGISIFWCDIS